MKNRLILCCVILTALVLSGCQKYDPVYADDLDLVVTNYSKDCNFSIKKTYAMPDSVILVTSETFDGTVEYAKQPSSNTIVAAIKKNMAANGWTLVNKNNLPDVLILASVSQTTNIYYSYNYWNWYYPGSYGWYYPGYYYPPTASAYKTGSLFIQMTDISEAASNDQLPVVWTSLVNGLLEGSTAEIQLRINSAVDQAFKQSPYLKK